MQLFLMITVQEIAHPDHGSTKLLSFRKHDQTEMIRLCPVEAAAGNHQNVGGAKQIPGEYLVIGDAEFGNVQLGEQVEGCSVLHIGNTIDGIQNFHRSRDEPWKQEFPYLPARQE